MRFTVFALIILAACQEQIPPPEQKPDGNYKTCGADKYQGLIGKSVDVLNSMKITQPMRIIWPGISVTMDYSAERLNVGLNKRGGKIIRLSCG